MVNKYLKKFWHFIWEEDSIWSWIANIILAFFLIKFIVFPVLGFALGSEFPVVAVVSSSMEHDGSFDDWWNSPAFCGSATCTQSEYYSERNISKEDFDNFAFTNGFNKGDIMVLTSAKNIKVGDVIVFFSKDSRPIIHRVISVNPLQTKGDHNQDQIVTSLLNEKEVYQYHLIGKASLRIPLLGYVKILFADFFAFLGVRVS